MSAEDVPSYDYKYDVAISFLSPNLSVAAELEGKLRDRLSVFLYTKEQPHVIGSFPDGVEAYSAIFGKESRVCVILHSAGWGDAGMSGVENSAMKGRGLVEGWDFLIAARLDDAPLPKWVPPESIWYALREFGIDGMVPTIHNRLLRLGGKPIADPLIVRAIQQRRSDEHAVEMRTFLHSGRWNDVIEGEFERTAVVLNARLPALNEAYPAAEFRCEVIREHGRVRVVANSKIGSFGLYWERQFSNALDGAYMSVVELDKPTVRDPYRPIQRNPSEPLVVAPTLGNDLKPAWVFPGVDHPLHTERLVDLLLQRVLDRRGGPEGKKGPSVSTGSVIA